MQAPAPGGARAESIVASVVRVPLRYPSMFARSLVLVFGALAVAACSREKQATPNAAEPAPTISAAPAVQSATAPPPAKERVTWKVPDGFRESPSASAMRKATYVVPRGAGDTEDAELAVFYFGASMGGSIEANEDRWIKQFSGVDPKSIKRDQRSSNGLVQHTIQIESGTYASGMPGGPSTPKPKQGLLGAIVETPVGNYFFKLTGPEKTVAGAKGKFIELLDSVQAK